MVRRPALRFAVLLAVLAFLLPLAAGAARCEDCLWEPASPACCPLSCCPCCPWAPSVLTASAWSAVLPAPVDLALSQQQAPDPSSPPRDIFHVPKAALL